MHFRLLSILKSMWTKQDFYRIPTKFWTPYRAISATAARGGLENHLLQIPTGKPVAMVHCNNCCTDLDYWVKLFIEFSSLSGSNLTKGEIYDLLYNEALKGDSDCGKIVSINYFSGEPVTGFLQGRPMVLRSENSNFNLANFMRTHIYSAIATLKIGIEILEEENVDIDKLMGHGGLFKTKYVGQKLMAGAMEAEPGAPQFLRTVRGIGYKLTKEEGA